MGSRNWEQGLTHNMVSYATFHHQAVNFTIDLLGSGCTDSKRHNSVLEVNKVSTHHGEKRR